MPKLSTSFPVMSQYEGMFSLHWMMVHSFFIVHKGAMSKASKDERCLKFGALDNGRA
jgi:hypothetical protein